MIRSSLTRRTAFAVLALGTLVGACGDDPPPAIDAAVIDAPPPTGRVSLSWTIVDDDNMPLTCTDVGASTVELDVAMRLLAGPHRRRMLTGFGLLAIGSAALIVGMLAGLARLLS